jgi:outer membrane protein OmpA-like peptidoglycan-associated protein
MKTAQALGFCIFLLMGGNAALAQKSKANQLYEASAYDEAIKEYKKIIEKNGDDKNAIRRLAYCYWQVRNYTEAYNWYNLLDKKGIERAEDRYYFGHVLKSLGQYEKAKKQFELYKKSPGGIESVANKMLASVDSAIRYSTAPNDFVGERIVKLNSNRDDFAPVLFRGDLVYASSRDYSDPKMKYNPRSGQPNANIYRADILDKANVDVPVAFGGKVKDSKRVVNSLQDEGPVTFDPSGQIMYFTRSFFVRPNPDLQATGTVVLKIYQAELVNGEWTNVKELPFNSNRFSCAHPSMSKDGKTLYFASDRHCKGLKYRYRDFDIYAVTYDGKKWGKPYNLGDTVNTPGHEAFPNIHPSGKLFFASNYHPGIGGFDMFEATPDKDGKKWISVRNLRGAVNSPGDEVGIVFTDNSLQTAYVASNRSGGFGGDDIYYVYHVSMEKKPEVQTIKKIYVSGTVIEEIARKNGDRWEKVLGKTLADVALKLRKSDGRTFDALTGSDGRFKIEVDSEGNYSLVADKPGYFVTQTNISQSEFQQRSESEIVAEKRIPIEKIVLDKPGANRDTLPRIFFDLDKSDLKQEFYDELDQVARLMTDNPRLKVEIAGHACPISYPAYNYLLSDRRAMAAFKYLTEQKGIAADRLVVVGYGEDSVLTKDFKEYAKNRRDEFVIRDIDYPSGKATPGMSGASGTHRGRDYSLNPDGTYTVKKGDTLYGIAVSSGVSVHYLKKINNLKTNLIEVGQVLKVR